MTTQQNIDTRDTIEQMLLTLIVEERRALLTRLTMYNTLIAQLKPDGTKSERERRQYEARQAEHR